MRRLILTLFIVLVMSVGVVQAAVVEDGTGHYILSCFYECKEPVTTFYQSRTWQEVTTLVLVNQNDSDYVVADILFFDGKEKPIAYTKTDLSAFDVDELNVCETLNIKNVPVIPSAGMIQVRLFDGSGYPLTPPLTNRVSGWVKNLLGKFTKGVGEPFSGTVSAIGKTECDPMLLPFLPLTPEVPSVRPILIENTGLDTIPQ